ncbi:hypothetical protein WJX84_002928, partial [Apatococcus fuscideae]
MQALLEAARGADDSLAEAAVARLQKACLAPENQRELTCLAAGGVLSEYFSELSGNFRGDSTGVDRLLPLLRLLRNMCVGNEAACQHMVAARAHVTASQLVTLQTPLPQVSMVIKISGQLLANLATCRAGAISIWRDLFPSILLAMLQVPASGVQGPVCMMLLSCQRLSTTETAKPAGDLQEQYGQPEAVSRFSTDLFRLMTALSSSQPSCRTHVPGPETSTAALQAAFQLARAASAQEDVQKRYLLGVPGREGLLRLMLNLLRALPPIQQQTGAAAALQRTHAHSTAPPGSSHAAPAEHDAQESTSSAGHGLPGDTRQAEQPHASQQPADSLSAMDRTCQESPPNSYHGSPLRAQHVADVDPAQSAVQHELQDHPSRGGSGYHKQAPYTGYRSDVVAVIANLVHNQRSLQDLAMANGGVELLLSQCQIDSGSPLVREWGLWAIRNMCEGNVDVQQHIEALQLQGAAPHPDLDRLGFRVEMDGKQPAMKP